MIPFGEIINSKVFKYIFGAFSIIYSISFISWNYFADSYYYYLLFPEYESYPLIALTLYIGNLFVKYISQDMLWLNFLSWLLCFLSVTLIYWGCVRKGQRFKFINFYFAGLCILGYGTYTLYGPDTLSLFFLSLIGYLLCRKPTIQHKTILTVSVLTALLVASRLPNVVLMPIVVGYITVKDIHMETKTLSIVSDIIFYLFLSVAFYIALVCALLGTTDLYAPFIEAFTYPVSSYNTHTISNLVNTYRGDFYVTMKDLFWFVGAITISCICGLATNKSKILQLAGLLPLIYILIKEQDKLLGAMYGWKNLFAFLVILLMIIFIIKRKDPAYTLDTLLLISLGFIMASGSDTGFMKIGVFFSAISPIVFIEYDRIVKFNFFSGAVFTVVLFYSLYYYGMQFVEKAPYAMIHYPHATQLISLEKKSLLESMLADAEKYGRKDHCIFLSINGFRAQAIMGSKMLYKCSFWQKKEDEIEADHIIQVMRSDSLCTVFDYNNSIVLKKKMEKIGVKCIQQTNATIYKH